jgi:hypothetical protein
MGSTIGAIIPIVELTVHCIWRRTAEGDILHITAIHINKDKFGKAEKKRTTTEVAHYLESKFC